MCILVQESDSPLIAEDIQSQANRACEKIQEMAAAVIALSFKGATSLECGGGRNSAHSARIAAEFAIDVLRSVSEEALTGSVRRLGYADAMSLQAAWTARLDQNAAARRASVSPLSVAMRAVDATPADAPLMAAAHARGAAIAALMPALGEVA